MGRAVWRLLHEHLGHRLQAVTDHSPAWFALTDTGMDFIGRPGGSHAVYID